MTKKITKEDILALFSKTDLCEEEAGYLYDHCQRLTYTVNRVQEYVDKYKARKILDVGPHFLTYCLNNFIRPEPEISTLGFADKHLFPMELAAKHYEIDLNFCDTEKENITDKQFDLIVFSEVLEHLYTSPQVVFFFLKKLLKPKTGALLVETPNAASIGKRLKLLIGRNPYCLIREQRTNPGHFREYTMDELYKYATETEFSILKNEYYTYRIKSNLIQRVADVIPWLREGITLLLINK